MEKIIIYLKDGDRKEFHHEGRSGGSYTKGVKFERGWVIVTDEWGRQYVFPEHLVQRVDTTPLRRW